MSPGSKIHADNVPKTVHQPNRRAPVLSTRNDNLHRLGEAIVDPIATTYYCSSPVVRGSSRGQASTQAACGPRVRRRQDGIKFQGTASSTCNLRPYSSAAKMHPAATWAYDL